MNVSKAVAIIGCVIAILCLWVTSIPLVVPLICIGAAVVLIGI